MKSLIIKWFSLLLVFAGLYFCASKLHSNYNALPYIQLNAVLILKLAIIVTLILFTGVLFSIGWKLLLNEAGFQIRFLSTYTIIGRSQIGKYLPGNIFHYVGRAAMGVKEGIPPVVVTSTIAVETVLVLIVTSILVFVGLPVDNANRKWILGNSNFEHIAGYLVVIVLVLTIAGYCMRSKKNWLIERNLLLMPIPAIKVGCLYLAIFIVYGVVFTLIPWSLWGEISPVAVSNSIWRFALCYLAGFVVPGAPAGLGVREAMFTKLFSPELGEGGAACVALVFRVLTTVGDLLTFAVAWWVGRRVLTSSKIQ